MKYHFSLTKKCLCCLLGLAVSGFGVAFSTYPDLGTSPISGLPYVMTFIYPLSFGTWTVLVNCLFIVIQAALLGKKFGWAQLLQIPAVTVFGFFIDLGMWLAGCRALGGAGRGMRDSGRRHFVRADRRRDLYARRRADQRHRQTLAAGFRKNENRFRRLSGRSVVCDIADFLRRNHRHPRRHADRRFDGRIVHPPVPAAVQIL